MAAKNQGNGGEMQYGDDDASRKRLRKENGVRNVLILRIYSITIIIIELN
jgi:hypothetical protein